MLIAVLFLSSRVLIAVLSWLDRLPIMLITVLSWLNSLPLNAYIGGWYATFMLIAVLSLQTCPGLSRGCPGVVPGLSRLSPSKRRGPL